MAQTANTHHTTIQLLSFLDAQTLKVKVTRVHSCTGMTSEELTAEDNSFYTMEDMDEIGMGMWDAIQEFSKKCKNRSRYLEECLIRATLENSFGIMKKLIVDENVDPNATDIDGTASIHLIVDWGDVTTLRFFLSLSEKININIQDGLGRTPLIVACSFAWEEAREEAREEVLQVLLRCPALDVNMADKRGKTALLAACYDGYETIVSMLLGHEHIQVNKADHNKKSPLMAACGKSFIGVVKLLLNMDDIHINAENKFHRTALTLCCTKRTPESVETRPKVISMLLQREELETTENNLEAITYFVMNTWLHGIDIRDARDMRTLIEEAVSKNLDDIARWLLKTEGYLLRVSTSTAAIWGSSAAARRPLRRRSVLDFRFF